MLIESRTLVGMAAAFALVGAVLWGSALLFNPPPSAQVEVQQLPGRSWAVEVKELGFDTSNQTTQTAAAVR